MPAWWPLCSIVRSWLTPFAIFSCDELRTPSSHRRRKLVEIDMVGFDAVHLQDRQHGIDHWRRTARVGIDRTGQFLFAQMAQHDLMDESGLPVPPVIRLRMRQRRYEFEVLQLRRDGRQLLEI